MIYFNMLFVFMRQKSKVLNCYIYIFTASQPRVCALWIKVNQTMRCARHWQMRGLRTNAAWPRGTERAEHNESENFTIHILHTYEKLFSEKMYKNG